MYRLLPSFEYVEPETIEEVLQAVNVPIIVGGCGDPKKDAEVFKRVAEVAHGERVMLSSLTLDMAEAGILGEVAEAAREHGHVALAFTAMELNSAKELNRSIIVKEITKELNLNTPEQSTS